jgi:hypothetical protein
MSVRPLLPLLLATSLAIRAGASSGTGEAFILDLTPPPFAYGALGLVVLLRFALRRRHPQQGRLPATPKESRAGAVLRSYVLRLASSTRR